MLLEIGITTKNRWTELEKTLHILKNYGLGDLRIVLFDDGSDTPCPYDVSTICRGAVLTRFEESQGLIARRNQIARAITSKYYLSLDDDSYPVSGSLDAVVEFAETKPDLLGINFPVYNPHFQIWQSTSAQKTPYRSRAFLGGAHVLHVENFLAVGGYRSELVHYMEEQDVAVRGFARGLHCYHFPDLLIHHMEVAQGRNFYRMDYYGARNNILWNDWYLPARMKPLRQSMNLASRTLLWLKSRRKGHIDGHLAGIRDKWKYRNMRVPLSYAQYLDWRSLPSL